MTSDQKKKTSAKSMKSSINSNAKWVRESAQIRKVQISLDFPDSADILLRSLAARQHKAPSSLVREILGMANSPPKRARIGVSFNDDELALLGNRYSIDPENRAEIRRRMTEEVVELLKMTEDKSFQLSVKSELENSEDEKEVSFSSEVIHKRFIAILAKRNS